MSNAFRPNGVGANAAFTTSVASIALTGRGAFVRMVNISQVTSISTDVQPTLYFLFGNDQTALDYSTGSGVPVTLTANNGIAISPGFDLIIERPSNATYVWTIGSATGRAGTSSGDLG